MDDCLQLGIGDSSLLSYSVSDLSQAEDSIFRWAGVLVANFMCLLNEKTPLLLVRDASRWSLLSSIYLCLWPTRW